MKKLWIVLSIVGLLVIGTGCGQKDSADSNTQTVKLGLVGEDTDIWDSVKARLEKEGINLEYVKFTDYNQPNTALAEGSIDVNAFQHQFFLDNFNKEHDTELVSIGNTVNAPLGIYSDKLTSLDELKAGAEITIPNDVTNGGRALLLLQAAGLIEVDPTKELTPTVSDITKNELNLKISELDASQTARTLSDVDAAVINSGLAVDAGLAPNKDALFLEPVDEQARPYVNIIVVNKADADNEIYQKIVDTYQTEETAKVIEETSKGANVAAWETFGRK